MNWNEKILNIFILFIIPIVCCCHPIKIDAESFLCSVLYQAEKKYCNIYLVKHFCQITLVLLLLNYMWLNKQPVIEITNS